MSREAQSPEAPTAPLEAVVVHPLTIVSDRYSGSYSGGAWTAWPLDFYDVPEDIDGGDCECMAFWLRYRGPVGRGHTPQEALNDLLRVLDERPA